MSAHSELCPSVLIEHARKKRKIDVGDYATSSEEQFGVLPHKVPWVRTPTVDRHEQIFEHYSTDRQCVTVGDMRRFAQELHIELASYETLVFYFLCEAKRMEAVAKSEFLHGLHILVDRIDSLSDVQAALIRYDISDNLRNFYLWIFHFGLAHGQRCLPVDQAVRLWRLFYSRQPDRSALLHAWISYLQRCGVQLINADTWMVLLHFFDFIHTHGYESYDVNDAWPCVFDGFVSYQKATNLLSA